MRRVVTAVVVAAGLAGCASLGPLSSTQLANADYGEWMDSAASDRAVQQFLNGRLKDPMSAIVQCQQPYQGYLRDPPIMGAKPHFGYVVECQVNAKNSFGGYTGAKRYAFVLRNGAVVAAYAEQQDRYSSYMGKIL